jgi:ribosomal protein S18 acetylase RimI-like enzyme
MALGAFEDSGALIGAVAIGMPSSRATSVGIAVTPERRRLKIGTDLFQALVVDHLPATSRQVVFSHPVSSEPAFGFLRSLELDTVPVAQDATMVILSKTTNADRGSST